MDDPSVQGLVFNTRDVSERKELEEQLTHQAFHDPLTDLANRSLFRDRVEHALALRRSLDEPISVLFIDVDDFKTVNDSLGHSAGDELLLQVADRIRSCLREGDTAARLGGDEFAILLEDGSDPPAVADRLIEAFKAPFRIQDKDLTTTISIGISGSAQKSESADEILRNADAAMYAAKGRGKGFYEFFEQDMHTTAMRRLDLEGDLRRAVHRKEFRVHYQPIVGLASGRVAGFEALVRWAHPSRGLLSPSDFIGLAEETGLIVPIGRWVLREACRQATVWQTQWPSDPPLTISVNLSAEQLEASDLIRDVKAALRQSGLPAETLGLEITESVLMRNTDKAIARLEKLKALGVRLSIDDFGTGFSSLSYLQNLPCDSLKVPKPFLDGLGKGGQANSLVRGIVELGRTLGLTVIAEGVEKARQWEALEELRCDLVQGYYFARPQSAERIDALLKRHAAASLAARTGGRPPRSGLASRPPAPPSLLRAASGGA
jgi:diguanylate cyclase (GGDEF)-like protein